MKGDPKRAVSNRVLHLRMGKLDSAWKNEQTTSINRGSRLAVSIQLYRKTEQNNPFASTFRRLTLLRVSSIGDRTQR